MLIDKLNSKMSITDHVSLSRKHGSIILFSKCLVSPQLHTMQLLLLPRVMVSQCSLMELVAMIPLQPPLPPTAASQAMEPSLDTVASRLILHMVSSQLQQHLPGQHMMDGLSNLGYVFNRIFMLCLCLSIDLPILHAKIVMLSPR